MKKKIVGIFVFLIFLFSIFPVVIGANNEKNIKDPSLKVDNLPFSKKMELEPHLLFYIAFGDFYVDGNYVNGTAKILFWLCMKYFIFPEIPHIEFNTDFGAKIISDFYDYYKIMYTNHTIIIFAIYR
jgi:hypothetical protein